jgi:hypothetical protein
MARRDFNNWMFRAGFFQTGFSKGGYSVLDIRTGSLDIQGLLLFKVGYSLLDIWDFVVQLGFQVWIFRSGIFPPRYP